MTILNRAGIVLIPFLGQLLIRFLKLTMRMTYVNFEGYRALIDGPGNIILSFWHGRLLMMPYSYPGTNLTALASNHRDGELVSRTLSGFGIRSARGSTSRGWFGGIKGLLKTVRGGGDVAIVPDGPRGPGMKAQMGAIQIAKATGLPIIPMSFGASKKKILSSWDAFIIPYPFSRGVFIAAGPIYVDAKAGGAEMEEARGRLENTLNKLTTQADNYFR